MFVDVCYTPRYWYICSSKGSRTNASKGMTPNIKYEINMDHLNQFIIFVLILLNIFRWLFCLYILIILMSLLVLQYIRCAQSDYGCYNVTEPPIDAPRDPMYKSEREVLKVWFFLWKIILRIYVKFSISVLNFSWVRERLVIQPCSGKGI